MTDKIVWTPDMSVGVDRLDEDHKKLVAYLNDYIEAIDNDEGIFVTDGIFAGLLEYTRDHFSREERIMEACGYPDLAAHKAVHEEMAAKVMNCRSRYMLNADTALEEEVRQFLLSWLREHILRSDMDYKAVCEAHPEAVAKVLAEEGAEERAG